MTSPQPAIELRSLGKTFTGGRVLKDVNLSISPGEVHGLVGENGSGKSTLIKVLAGYHAPDPGSQLYVDGREVRLPLQPGEFQQLGFSFVHQHLGLVPSMTVLENLFVGEFAVSRQARVSWTRLRERARRLLTDFGVALDTQTLVRDLSPTERALLAIVRATEELRVRTPSSERYRGLLILDEVTVFLPASEVHHVFNLVKDIADGGASVLFVSHHLDQIRAVTHRVSVLRDGVLNGPHVTADVTDAELVRLIVGSSIDSAPVARSARDALDAHLTVEDLECGNARGVSFRAGLGEIVGLAGLVGSGFTDVLYGMFGAREMRGRMQLGNTDIGLEGLTPREAIKHGISLVPSDRARDGGVGSMSVGDNSSLMVLSTFFERLLLRRRKMTSASQGRLEKFSVRPSFPWLSFDALSGGNQQKVVLSKWLSVTPQLLLLDEPTQGVDIGARHQIWQIIREAAASGCTVICASSDYEQLEMLCDRVLIVSGGVITEEVTGDEITRTNIAEKCYGGVAS